jgi:hypothetical protein
MNFAERLAGLYLRLNGFFLMPEFSTFRVGLEKGHAHVDLIAFRPGSREIFEGIVFPLDAAFYHAVAKLGGEPFSENVALVCEVRTNFAGEFPNADRVKYAAEMCGTNSVVSVSCDRSLDHVELVKEKSAIKIGLLHMIRWIAARISWLDKEGVPKSASWNWSEPALADFLVLNQLIPIQYENESNMFVWSATER